MLKHCPKDCLRRHTCHRGKPLPFNKDVCYTPPKAKILFTKENPDWQKHYQNVTAYNYELIRELKEHQKFIDKIRRAVKEGDRFTPTFVERIERILEESPKYVT